MTLHDDFLALREADNRAHANWYVLSPWEAFRALSWREQLGVVAGGIAFALGFFYVLPVVMLALAAALGVGQ